MGIDAVYMAIIGLMDDKTPDEVKAMMQDRSGPMRLNVMRMRRYHKSKEAALRFDCIGVGCISFADARLKEFDRRVSRVIK